MLNQSTRKGIEEVALPKFAESFTRLKVDSQRDRGRGREEGSREMVRKEGRVTTLIIDECICPGCLDLMAGKGNWGGARVPQQKSW